MTQPDEVRLGPQQLDEWRAQGWVRLPGFVADEIAAVASWVDEVSGWAPNGPGLHHLEATRQGPVLARSERFVDDHDRLDGFVRRGRVASVVAGLLGEPAVLFKEKVNYKHPGGGGFAPHQDATAYRFVDHHVSALVAIDPATADSGCLWFAPGHDQGQLATDVRGRIEEAVAALLPWEPVELEPGDVVLFDSYAPHRSGTNGSTRSRWALYLTYNAVSRGDHRQLYYEDKGREFAREGGDFDGERVRISVSDDFLGRPVEPPAG